MDSRVDFSLQDLKKVAELIKKHSAIELDDKKLLRFKRKIEDVAVKNNISNFAKFYHQLRFLKNQSLLSDLISAVTINETYFWRESEQFDILTKEILPRYASDSKLNSVRILIIPSSSGEEVYSIMIAILESKDLIEKLNIGIVGADIDSQMIKKAKTGLFSERSVSMLPKELFKKYFTKSGSLYKIDQALIKGAKFYNINIFDEKFFSLGKFDIVFSRNMLIYFDKKDKKRALQNIYNILNPNGYLFLGHADANEIDREKFISFKNGSFVFQKR